MKRWFTFVLLAIAATLGASAAANIRWNVSPSVEPGLYRLTRRPPARGDLVAVCLPETVGRWAHGRGYLRAGSCPGGSAHLGKRVLGVGGDRVAVSEAGITVSGRLEAASRLDRDSKGRPVPLVPMGELVLAAGEVWLHSGRHARSLDSRVFGPLEVSSVEGVMIPLWILAKD